MKTTKAAFCFIFFTISFLNVSCESAGRTASQKKEYKNIYVNQFKLTYFRRLLSKSYNNSNAIQEVIGFDHSGFTEPILTREDYKLIDSLTTIDNLHLIADSISGGNRAEAAQGKRPLGFIMDQLSSKWLDSLAKQRLKINGDPRS